MLPCWLSDPFVVRKKKKKRRSGVEQKIERGGKKSRITYSDARKKKKGCRHTPFDMCSSITIGKPLKMERREKKKQKKASSPL